MHDLKKKNFRVTCGVSNQGNQHEHESTEMLVRPVTSICPHLRNLNSRRENHIVNKEI